MEAVGDPSSCHTVPSTLVFLPQATTHFPVYHSELVGLVTGTVVVMDM